MEKIYGACGNENCFECLPLYDENNNVIPGTDDTTHSYRAYCTECDWHTIPSNSKWLIHRKADIHRGVYAHHVIENRKGR